MQSVIRALFSIEIRVIRFKPTKYDMIGCGWLLALVKYKEKLGNKSNYYYVNISGHTLLNIKSSVFRIGDLLLLHK